MGLRGNEIGGAKVSDIHPNYIINTGTATAESILILTSLIKAAGSHRGECPSQGEVQMVGFESAGYFDGLSVVYCIPEEET